MKPFCKFSIRTLHGFIFARIGILLISMILIVSCQSGEAQLRQKANAIHRKVLTLDSHVDTPLVLFREGFDLGQRNDPHSRGGKLDFPRMEEGGLDATFFAVFIGQGRLDPEAYEVARNRALDIFDRIHLAVAKYPDLAEIALSPEDAIRLKAEGKRAVFIGVENGYPLGEDLSLLQDFYVLGGRYLGLSHTRNNQLCDSSTDHEGALHGGLSNFGREVVKELNRLGMMVDVSHISDQAFYDVLEVTQAPIIASHSNARAVCDNPRNLDDDMLKALAANGGVVQLCMLSSYVKDTPPNLERDSVFADLRQRYNQFENLSDEEMNQVRREWTELDEAYPPTLAAVSDLIDHLDHIVNLIGIDYVGIGTDFDGGGALSDCYDVSELGNITLEMLRRGYTEDDIQKVWSGNFFRVFRNAEEMAKKQQ